MFGDGHHGSGCRAGRCRIGASDVVIGGVGGKGGWAGVCVSGSVGGVSAGVGTKWIGLPRFAHGVRMGCAIGLESISVQDLADKEGLAWVGGVHGVMDNVSDLFDVDAHGDGSATKGDFV